MEILVDGATLLEEKHISCMDLDIVYIMFEQMLNMLHPLSFLLVMLETYIAKERLFGRIAFIGWWIRSIPKTISRRCILIAQGTGAVGDCIHYYDPGEDFNLPAITY